MYSILRGVQNFFLKELKPLFMPQRNLKYTEMIKDTILHLPKKNLKILDVGGNSGIQTDLLIKVLQRIGYKLVTPIILDIDRKSLLHGKKLYRKIQFIRGDAHYLPFRHNVFHIVYSYSLFEHLKEPRIAINEQIRVSKKLIVSQIPNIYYFIEIHTKTPLLYFYPDNIRRNIVEATNPGMFINFNVNCKNVIKWFQKSGAELFKILKIFHFRWAKLIIWPQGYLLFFRKCIDKINQN